MKSALYAATTSSAEVQGNGIIPIESTIRRFGQNIKLDGNSITLLGSGYYDVSFSLSFYPTDNGSVSVSCVKDGVAVPGSAVYGFAVSADNPMSLNGRCIVRVGCCEDFASISFLQGITGGTIINFNTVVEKI